MHRVILIKLNKIKFISLEHTVIREKYAQACSVLKLYRFQPAGKGLVLSCFLVQCQLTILQDQDSCCKLAPLPNANLFFPAFSTSP